MTALEAELSFYGQILGFAPPGVPQVKLSDARPGSAGSGTGGHRGAGTRGRAPRAGG